MLVLSQHIALIVCAHFLVSSASASFHGPGSSSIGPTAKWSRGARGSRSETRHKASWTAEETLVFSAGAFASARRAAAHQPLRPQLHAGSPGRAGPPASDEIRPSREPPLLRGALSSRSRHRFHARLHVSFPLCVQCGPRGVSEAPTPFHPECFEASLVGRGHAESICWKIGVCKKL